MADSVFKPLTPEQMQGPFSGFLQPTPGQQQTAQAGPPTMAGTGTSLGFIANKFIQGAMEGRVKAFEKSENDKWQRYQGFTGFVNNIMPSLTVEGQQYILSQLSQVMGSHGQEAAGGGTGKGKKGQKQSADTYPSAGGKVLATGNASAGAEDGGIMHHVTNALRDVFTGMTGGKTPKGGIDVGGKQAEISAKLFDETGQIRPEFSRSGVVQANLTEANRILDSHPPGTTLDVADKSIAPQMQKLLQYAPDQYAAMQGAMGNRFRRGPQTPQEDIMAEAVNRELHPPGPPAPAPSNVGPGSPGNYPANARGAGVTPQPGPPQGASGGSAQAGPPVMGQPGPRRGLVEQAQESLYGKRERVNLENPAAGKSGEHVSAEWNPRAQMYEDPSTGIPLPPDQQKWLKVTTVYHPPVQAIQHLGDVVGPGGKAYMRILDPDTRQPVILPGALYKPPNMSAQLAEWRRDDAFNNHELSLYTRYASNVQSINSRWDAAASRIEMATNDATIDKPKARKDNEDRREKELSQALGDRDQLLETFYKQHKKEFHKAGESDAKTPDVSKIVGRIVIE